MEYAVLIERKKESWRAFIPALADLDAEGDSRDEAVRNVQRAAEAYLSSVEVITIKVKLPQKPSRRPGSPRALLRALEAFAGDEEALQEHFEEIARERQKQRAEARQQDAECVIRAGYRHHGFCFPTASYSATTPAAFT
jgi:predicted RNase H-like HicB family nuclease